MKNNHTHLNFFPRDKRSAFFLPGVVGQLEVATTFPQQAPPRAIIIICHPDPRQQGTMNNKVVVTIARAADRLGYATLRFNFRGVGASQGSYGHIGGELEDLQSMMLWVDHVLPAIPIGLAGFSFGSYISAKVANEQLVNQLISIAPPVNHYDFTELRAIHNPWLIVQGDQDEVVPYDEVMIWHKNMQMPNTTLVTMNGASHFFHGRLLELQDIIEQHLRRYSA